MEPVFVWSRECYLTPSTYSQTSRVIHANLTLCQKTTPYALLPLLTSLCTAYSTTYISYQITVKGNIFKSQTFVAGIVDMYIERASILMFVSEASIL